jgi:hypothetical protein
MLVSSGSSSSAKREDDGDKALARALGNLELREGLDNVYIGEQELVNMKKKARWLAVARVHMKKPFSMKTLFQTLCFVSGLANDPELREADKNMYTFKFFFMGH